MSDLQYSGHDIDRSNAGPGRGYLAAVDRAIEADPWEDYATADTGPGRARAPGAEEAEARNASGAARYGAGDLAGALADFDEAIRLDPDHAAAHANRGVVRHAVGDLNGALADLDRALALDPGDAEAAYNRGLVRHVRGDLDDALADFDRALRLDPGHVQACIARGGTRYHSGDPGAHADYRMALQIDPRTAATKIVRKLAADLREDPVAVLANCARHLRRGPDIVAHGRRGLSLLLMGRDAEAEGDFSSMLRLSPGWVDPLDQLIAEAGPLRGSIPSPTRRSARRDAAPAPSLTS